MTGTEPLDDADRGVVLGDALLAARTKRRVGVRELARRVGVSPSLISRIEKGTVMPSVATLFALADALDARVAEILGDPVPGPAPDDVRPVRTTGAVPPSQGVQRSADRDRIDLASGARWERLTPGPDPVHFTYSVYGPGGASSPGGEFLRHAGREYGYVISGRLAVKLGFETFHLEPGDSIAFDSSVPHRLFNEDDVDAVTIWVVIP